MSSMLLLPGWGMETTVWEPIREELSLEFQLYSVDWRGVESYQEFTSRVLEITNGRNSESLTLLGWSLGSLVALEIASQYPSLVSNIILLGGTSRFTTDGEEYEAGWHPRIIQRMKRQLALDPEKTLHAFYASMFSQPELEQGYYHRFLANAEAHFQGDRIESLMLGLDYLLQADLSQRLSLQPRMLLIHGEEDGICPHAAVHYIAEHAKGAVLRTIPKAGHIPFYTQPRVCLNWIKPFVRGELVD